MTSVEDEFVAASQLVELPLIAGFLQAACRRAGIKQTACLDLELAVEEACTNVIEHAYGGQGGEMRIHFAVRDQDVVITIRDRGRSFDPNAVPKPDLSSPLEDRAVGGLGLHLMQQLMDEVHFTFSETEGNILTMIKRQVAPGRTPDKSEGEANDG